MNLIAAAPRFALLIVGVLMVVLAAVGAVLTAPDADAAAQTETVTQSAVTGSLIGGTASGSGGNIG